MTGLKIAIKQPYFMPYIGFWQEVSIVDKYIFFDDVNYIKKGWINRNNILVGGRKHLFTMELRNASQNSLINEIEICDSFDRLKKTIFMAYRKAPYFDSTMCLIEKILSFDNKNLARFVGNSICEVSRFLGFKTSFVFSSDLGNDKTLKRQDKIIDICKFVDAAYYYDSTGALDLYNKGVFSQNGICLQFVKSEITPYKQYNNEFVPGLSIIDVLMFNDISVVGQMLTRYHLI